jgi:uncharacterized protein YhaN
MRIVELCLERYGRFENCRLPMRGGSPDFHIIFGANEAGKSTTLAAVSDLLFGIPQRSPYNFRFDYALMRIGGVIEEGGRQLVCRRRKTLKHSLVDGADQPLDEGQLVAMLHGLNRETFGSGFSLDQAGLRRGGEAMVKANDDLGQALFAAGSGLTGIAAVQAALEEESDGIWGRRASAKRTFTIAERQLDDSLRLLREHQLRPKEWTDARAAVEKREQEVDALKQRQTALSGERRAAERLRRIGPPMRLRLSLLEEISGQGEVLELLPHEEAKAEATLKALGEAAFERDRAVRLRDDATERLAALAPDPIAALADDIEALVERRGAVAKAAEDRVRRDIERRGMEKRAAALRAELGAEGELPSRLTVSKLRGISSRHAGAAAILQTREDSLADLQARAAPLRQELIDAPLPEGLGALRPAVALARALGDDFDLRCTASMEAAERAEEDACAAMAQLAPWSGEAGALARLAVIGELEVQAAQEAELSLARKLDEARAEQRRCDDELQRLDAESRRLAATGSAVPPDALAEARSAREKLWQEIDGHLAGRRPLPEPEAAARSFEAAASTADAVADRRYETAEASAKLASLEDRRAEFALLREQAAKRIEDAEQALSSARIQWRERLTAIALPALEPGPLRNWYEHRKTALDRQRSAIEARQQANHNLQRRAEAADALRGAMAAAPPAGDRLSLLLAAAERERDGGEALEQSFKDNRSRLTGLDEEIAALTRQIEQGKRAVDEARAEWNAEQAALGVPMEIGDIEARLALVEELRTSLDGAREHEQRVRAMDIDAQQFATDVAALAGKAGTKPEPDPSRMLDALRGRLAAARATQQAIETLSAEQARRQAEVDAATLAHEASLAALAPLLARCGIDDPSQLPATIERSRARRDAKTRLADAERQILTDGDGYSLTDLLAAWEACDPDAAAITADRLEQDLAVLTDELSTAADAFGEARRTFNELDERPQVTVDAASDAEAARAEMSAQAQIYMLRRTQSLILRWALDRYRERRQGPLLRRASELFQILTLGHFVELKADYEPAIPRLLGLRADGQSLVPVDGMSEGTTDQLFLALRLAAVEQAIGAGVNVPFLADDLFVNFDDERSEAGLRVLAELARSTQVLFFTHHAHLRDIGRRVVGAEMLSECVLS